MCGTSGDSTNGKCKAWCPSVQPPDDWSKDDYDPMKSPEGAGGCRGSWKPEDFGVFLHRTNLFEKEVQSKWGRRIDYNEIIVSGSHWTQHLPRTIEAFFSSDDHGHNRNDHVAQEQHSKFLREYGLTAQQVPLLVYHPNDWEKPFREARR